MSANDPSKETPVEVAKRRSRFLRGTIAEVLESDAERFEDDDAQVLKFHGAYQQDDRDQRRDRRARGLGKAHQFMVRCAIPGGVVTADQYLALDRLSDEVGRGSLRLTTRQGVQFHGVVKTDLKKTIAGINATLLTTFGACGDGRRNVMACPAPPVDAAHRLLRDMAARIAEQLRPATRAYHEIWLDEKRVVSTAPEEPFYGDRYLPRKFKIGLVLPSDNCVDVYTHDCGMVAIVDGGRIRGFNLLVGGGLGMTHGRADTFAALAEPLGFVQTEHAVEAVRAVAAVFRDNGNRSDRRHARLKYLIADWGLDRFREEVRQRVSFGIEPSVSLPPLGFTDHTGRHEQGDGQWSYGVHIENGRISDGPDRRTKAALRTIIADHRPGIAITPDQNLLLTDLPESAPDSIERVLRDHGVSPVTDVSAARRFSMACPALPTCGLALTESERFMPAFMDRLDADLAKLGLRDVPISVRMTGCPNGCARTYTADIALVGRRPGIYHVYVGGGLAGDRVVDLFAANVSADDLHGVLRPLLVRWARDRRNDEGLGDFYQRLTGRDDRRRSVTGKESPTSETIQLGESP